MWSKIALQWSWNKVTWKFVSVLEILPGFQRDCRGKSQTRMGGWCLCPLWCQQECFHFVPPYKKKQRNNIPVENNLSLLQKQVFLKYALTGVKLHLLILSFKDLKSISKVHMINLYIYNFIIISLSYYALLPHLKPDLLNWSQGSNNQKRA